MRRYFRKERANNWQISQIADKMLAKTDNLSVMQGKMISVVDKLDLFHV